MSGNCHTISPLQEIATCLVEKKCGRPQQGGCIAARMLFNRISEHLAVKTHYCPVIENTVSYYRCLTLITSAQCQQAESCNSPFWQALKLIAKKGEQVLQFREEKRRFCLTTDGGKESWRESLVKIPLPLDLESAKKPPSAEKPTEPPLTGSVPVKTPDIQGNQNSHCGNCEKELAGQPWMIVQNFGGICQQCGQLALEAGGKNLPDGPLKRHLQKLRTTHRTLVYYQPFSAKSIIDL